jgi:hypothetical protein
MTSVARLIVNLLKKTVLTIERGNIKELDANPGDKGCQMRAVLLREFLLSPEVSEELQRLKKSTKAIEKTVVEWKAKERRRVDLPILPQAYFAH